MSRKRSQSNPPLPLYANSQGWETVPMEKMEKRNDYKKNVGYTGLMETETGYVVTFKDKKRKNKFTLALSNFGIRVLDCGSMEEFGRWNFSDIKNVSFNANYRYFQFTTCINTINTQSYTFKSKQCTEIFEQTKALLEQNLRDNNVENFKSLIKKATHIIDRDYPKKAGIRQEVNEEKTTHKKLRDLIPEEAQIPKKKRALSQSTGTGKPKENKDSETKVKSARYKSEKIEEEPENVVEDIDKHIADENTKSYSLGKPKRVKSAIFNYNEFDKESFPLIDPIIELEEC
jgi:hypothetical protein